MTGQSSPPSYTPYPKPPSYTPTTHELTEIPPTITVPAQAHTGDVYDESPPPYHEIVNSQSSGNDEESGVNRVESRQERSRKSWTVFVKTGYALFMLMNSFILFDGFILLNYIGSQKEGHFNEAELALRTMMVVEIFLRVPSIVYLRRLDSADFGFIKGFAAFIGKEDYYFLCYNPRSNSLLYRKLFQMQVIYWAYNLTGGFVIWLTCLFELVGGSIRPFVYAGSAICLANSLRLVIVGCYTFFGKQL